MQTFFGHGLRAALIGVPLLGVIAAPTVFAQSTAQDPAFQGLGTSPATKRPAPATKTVKTKPQAAATSASETTSVHSMRHAGMWMFEYRYMSMVQEGILNNMKQIDPLSLLNNPNYVDENGDMVDSIGTDMTMDMHMFMAMYDVTSKFSLMIMGNYLVNSMNMTMDMGVMDGVQMYDTMVMETSGIGDTQIAAMFKLDDYLLYNPWFTLTVSLPTGSIDETYTMSMPPMDGMPMEEETLVQPYDMQLGSGTYDITPSLSMSNRIGPWQLGYEMSYLWRTHDNVENYRWGDRFKVDGWTKYTFPSRTIARVGVVYANWGGIEGRDTRISTNTTNYGGQRTDLSLGLAQELPGGFTVEGRYALPIHQSLDGFQMETDAVWELALQWMYMP